MYHTQSLLEAYYSIYNNTNKMSDNEMYEIIENYLLENFEFYSQEHLDEMISLLDEETIEAIIIEGLKDMSPEDRERWIKSQPDPELARKKLQKYESRGNEESKPEPEKKSGREAFYDAIRKSTQERKPQQPSGSSIFAKNKIRR